MVSHKTNNKGLWKFIHKRYSIAWTVTLKLLLHSSKATNKEKNIHVNKWHIFFKVIVSVFLWYSIKHTLIDSRSRFCHGSLFYGIMFAPVAKEGTIFHANVDSKKTTNSDIEWRPTYLKTCNKIFIQPQTNSRLSELNLNTSLVLV